MKGWRCPKCGSDQLRVQMTSWANLIQTLDRQDGVDENEWDTQPYLPKGAFDDLSLMDCNDCGYEAMVPHFIWHSPPLGTIPVIAERLSQ